MASSPAVRPLPVPVALRLAGLVLLSLPTVAGLAGPAAALESKTQQACIKASHKGFARVATAEARAAGLCLKGAAAGAPVQPTIAGCIAADGDGKIAVAQTKATGLIQKSCTEAPSFGPIDLSGAGVVAAASGARTAILEQLFGHDIEEALATKAGDADAAACQGALTKAVDRCWKTRVGAYTKCATGGLPSTIADAAGLAACRTVDPDGKVEKACVAGVQAALDKKCRGVTLDTRLPGCKCRYPQDCIAVTIANDVNAALSAAVNLPAADPVLPFVRAPQSISVGPWISPLYGQFVASRLVGREPDAPLACPLAAVNIYTVQDAMADAEYTSEILPLLANQHVRVLFNKGGPVDLTGSSPAALVQGTQATPLYTDARDFLRLSTRLEVFDLIELKHLQVGDTLNYGFETCLFNCESIYAEPQLPNIVFPGRLLIAHFSTDRATLEGAVAGLAAEAAMTTGVQLAWVGRVVADYKLELLDGSVAQTFHALPADGSVVYELDPGVDPVTQVLSLPALSALLASTTNNAVMITP
jgi:hypothetical protein